MSLSADGVRPLPTPTYALAVFDDVRRKMPSRQEKYKMVEIGWPA